MLRYALLTIRRSKIRVLLTTGGLGIAFGAVVFAYAVAAEIQSLSSLALDYVIRDATIWIAPSPGPRLDPGAQALAEREALPPEIVEALVRRSQGRLKRLTVGIVDVAGHPTVLYADEREQHDRDGVAISPALASILPNPTNQVNLGIRSIRIDETREALAGFTIVAPYKLGTDLLQSPTKVTWLVGNVPEPKQWAFDVRKSFSVAVTDSAALGQPAGEEKKIIIYLLEGSLSRFDPFTFRTKFSAFMLHTSMSTIFGWTARAVFLFGVILVVTSLSISVRERRAEVAVFTALGLQPEMTLLLFAETLLLLALVVPVGACIAAAMAIGFLPRHDLASSLLASLALTVFFLPVTLVVAGLWAGQVIAGRSDVDLVRERA